MLAVSTKALFLSFFFFFSNVIPPGSFSHSPVCAYACVLTVTRCYICSCALSPCRVKLWASAFGGEIKSIAAKYSGSQLLQKVRFLWWQEAMIFPAQKMEADLVFQTNVNPEQHQLSEVSLIDRTTAGMTNNSAASFSDILNPSLQRRQGERHHNRH